MDSPPHRTDGQPTRDRIVDGIGYDGLDRKFYWIDRRQNVEERERERERMIVRERERERERESERWREIERERERSVTSMQKIDEGMSTGRMGKRDEDVI